MVEIKSEDGRGPNSASGSRSPRVFTPTLKTNPGMVDDSFWSALLADAKEEEESSSSRPPTPPLPSESRSTSQSRSAGGDVTPRRNGTKAKEKEEVMPPLITDLPNAWDEAHDSFEVLERCVYESKKLGASRETDEMMVCDCVYDKRNPDAERCGPHSDCVNNAMFIECLAHECRAKDQCRNQRFNKRQFANLEIVKTDLKGFGLRAGSNIATGELIYEYIGEVIGENTFRKRMATYATEGIKHFYFMMLQKEEYIDATKKGGIGRFANHSCNPNCEVQKWVVGRRLRMGIFAKRDIHHNEELTFNYNVDRYGHDAQICYCGEPNCVGFIGGKTQTDIGGMDDLFLEALGITDQVEAEGMKGSKKKKARHLDEDFTPVLHPITEMETHKVAAAMRQSMENKRMMRMLLERVKMTESGAIHRHLIRLHGLSLMFMILTELAEDRDLVLLAMQSMVQWKLQHLNKIEDTNIKEPVRRLQASDDAELSELAQQLLGQWSSLELSYKIPRVSKIASLDAEDDEYTQTLAEAKTYTYSTEHRQPHAWENTSSVAFTVAPVKFRAPSSFIRPPPPPTPSAPKVSQTISNDRLKLDAIIALAQQQAAAAAAAAAALPTPEIATETAGESSQTPTGRRDEHSAKRAKTSHSNGGFSTYGSEEDEAARKERRMMKLVGEVVVRSMSKYKEMMDHDTFKKYARDCTHTLVEKEKRSSTYTNHRKPTLSDDKKAKIKSFTKEFTHKLMKRLKEKGKLKRPSDSARKDKAGSSSSLLSTPSGLAPSTPTTAPSTSLETPRTSAEADELDDIFGADDPDEPEDDGMDVDDGGEDTDFKPFRPSLSEGGTKGRMELLKEAKERRDREGGNGPQASPPLMRPVDTWQVGGGAQKKVNINGVAGKAYVGRRDDEGKDTPIRTPSSA